MMPTPLPDEFVRSRWATWQALQRNGATSYQAAPELNLSVGSRPDARAFEEFCRLSGSILDVGCGPQARPSYLAESADAVGLDPLRGAEPRGLPLVQGLGEYLPFRSASFDHVLFATSLDHTIDPRRSLAEAVRCLKPTGRLSLWLDAHASRHQGPGRSGWQRYGGVARKGLRSLSRQPWLSELGLRRTLSYLAAVARMKIPPGAVDYFHYEHLTLTVVARWLEELGLTVARQEAYPAADSAFVQAGRRIPTSGPEAARGRAD
jgi:SAM-dependent methyltransferase